MTETNFAEQLRVKTQRAVEKKTNQSWWQTFAPQLIKASELGQDRFECFEKLSPEQFDLCIEKTLRVEKTPRHTDAKLKDLPWYIISWGNK